MKIIYTGHSGFIVETKDQILLFDCIARGKGQDPAPEEAGVSCGILPDFDPAKKISVFISHSHGDHYAARIWKLAQDHENVEYFLGNDISRDRVIRDRAAVCGQDQGRAKIFFAQPDMTYLSEGMKVETLLSTDAGVAFYVTLKNGKTIFHAGYLLLWLWDENTPDENRFFKDTFYGELKRIAGRGTDIAFLPFDPRLEDKAALSIDEYLKALDVGFALPMHFWKRYDLVKRYVDSSRDLPFRSPVWALDRENQEFIIED